MRESNLFSRLSSYRPGSPATPFENYCTSGLAHLIASGNEALIALFGRASGAAGEGVERVEVQPQLGDVGMADLLLTFESGRRALVEVQVEPGADESLLRGFVEVARGWEPDAALVMLTLPTTSPPPGWQGLTWLQVVEAIEHDPDPVARQFAEFVLRDVLGLGPVPLDQAIASNRLYALGGAAVRRRFGTSARYVNSASRPIGGRYRYLGTTFSPDGGDMTFWIGLVNETVPLGEHYHLMLASKTRPLARPSEQPRATGDWKWPYWTGLGRVVRPITAEDYDVLLERLRLD